MSHHLPPCRHRGCEFAPGRWSCHSQRVVVPRGTDHELCAICPYADHPQPALSLGGEVPACGDRDGVVLGTYDTLQNGRRYGVEAVRLNLTVLRARCGPELPILVCDDGSPPESQERYRHVCAAFGAEFCSGSVRWGHATGDMLVYGQGIAWGARLGLRTVTKLSHRLIIDVDDWVRDDADRLVASGYGTCAQFLGNFPRDQIRSEGAMMVVRKWATPEVAAHFRPRPLRDWNERHMFRAICEIVDPQLPYPGFLPWPRLARMRGLDTPPVYFRMMRGHPHTEFRRLAQRYGITLSDHFSSQDSILSDAYLP